MTRAMPGAKIKPWSALTAIVPPGRTLLLGLLTVLVALTEGCGLLLLAPLLAALSGQPLGGMGLPAALATLPAALGLGPLLATFVALVAVRGGLQLARTMNGAKVERRVVEALRARAAAALLHAQWRALGALRPGEALALMIAGIDRVGLGLHELIALAAVIWLLGAAFVAALVLSPSVALAALVGAGGVVLAYSVVRRRSSTLGRELSHAYEHLNARLAETLGALRVVKSFSAERRAADELAQIDVALTANRVGYQILTGTAQAVLQAASALLLALLVWLAVAQWHIPAVVLLPLVALFARVLPLLAAVQQHWASWLNARPALDDTLALIGELEAAAEPAASGVTIPRPTRSIALTSVTVRHVGRAAEALAAVDITLPVGTTTALIGPSGAGKSTAADVLGGLLAPDEGALALDGHALSAVERIAWRGQVAYVQQEPVLFNLTVRENLLWAVPEAGPAALEQALRDASAEFVLALPAGLDTPVGDLGRQLSGGERQRIVLARALLRQPALLILDEPTSALDPANERAVADAVQRMQGKLTILIIGHRGALSELAERRVWLEAGRSVAGGEVAP